MKKCQTPLTLSLIFSFFMLTACVSSPQEEELSEVNMVSSEECETTKKAELENLLEEKKDTAFDLSGAEKNTGCTLGN